MQIIDVQNLPKADTPHKVDIKKVFSFQHVSFVHIELKPGETLKKHITPVDAFFYGLEGEGMVEIGDEQASIKKDQLVFSPAKIAHRLFNKSENTFRFLVIKTPTPTSETKLL